ncbi:MAG TPA: hypothetical protein VLE51_00820 [Candidatus Saccharimonadales bacterium]|nr:hypothetical protein [Candidatus Saccharimonadales bacterium]
MNAQPNIKRILLLATVVLVSIFLLWWLWQYLHTGTITITTNDKNNLIEIRQDKASKDIKQAKGSLKLSLHTGKYYVVVSNRASSTTQYTLAKARQASSYKIDVENLIEPEPVLPYGAYNILAGPQIYYVSMKDNLLYKIDRGGQPATSSKVDFTKIKWQNENYGAGINDAGDKLYRISNSGVTAVGLPFESNLIVFDLSKNGVLVTSDGKSVYISSGGAFNKIYSSSEKITDIAIGDSYILLATLKAPAKNNDKQSFKIINLQGKVQSASDISAHDYAWSPNGKYLAITSNSSTTIYDTSFKVVSHLPDASVVALTWLNDNALLYGLGSNLFSYNLQTTQSSQLAALHGASISGIYPGQDGSQVYLLEQTTGSKAHSFMTTRLNLNKSVPQYIYLYGLLLPVQIYNCKVSYVNFSQPLVSVLPSSSSASDSCIQSAKTYLAKDGLDVNKFSFYPEPSS